MAFALSRTADGLRRAVPQSGGETAFALLLAASALAAHLLHHFGDFIR